MELLGVDSETHLITPGCFAPKHVCTSFYTPGVGGELFTKDHAAIRERLLSGRRLVGAKIAYDMSVWEAAGILTREEIFDLYDRDLVADVQIREQLRRLAEGTLKQHKYSLAALAATYQGVHMPKGEDTWRLRYAELEDVPPEQWPDAARDYALDDARMPVIIYCEQEELPTERLQTRAGLQLHQMQVRGVETDLDLHARLVEECTDREAHFRSECLREGLLRPSKTTASGYSRNMAEIKARIERGYNGNPPRTEKGAVRTAAEVIEDLGDYPELLSLNHMGYAQKMRTTYLEAMDGPVLNCEFLVLKTSGRTGCRGPAKKSGMFAQGVRGCNIQNLPKKRKFGEGPWVRDLIRAREGHRFVRVDWDSMELRVMGQVCLDMFGASVIAENYQNDPDWDPHLWAARKRTGEVFPERDSPDWTAEHELKRNVSKGQIYGCLGGMGGNGLFAHAQKLGTPISLDLARSLARDMRTGAVFPELRAFFEYADWAEGRATPCGRYGRVRGPSPRNATANSLFQGPAADALKEAMWALRNENLVFEVHDEIVSEPEEEDALACLDRMVYAMTKSEGVLAVVPDVPLRASGKVTQTYGVK